MAIQILRGTASAKSSSSATLAEGQPFYETDTNKLYIGSGSTLSNAELAQTRPILDYVYPVGSIYMSISATNPSTLFGGTWERWGQGRVPVSVAESGTFASVEATGGEETHTLTTNEMPSHKHTGKEYSNGSHYAGDKSSSVNLTTITADFTTTTTTFAASNLKYGQSVYDTTLSVPYGISIGGSGAHNNLQPYITCYMWKRTA